jgi:hypothetical protein
LNHLWQRFLLTSSLLVGLAIGVAATVFGYSNLTSVDVHWSVFHINGIPLWTVAVVPLAFTIAVGALYHWVDSLHHFTEHMRHRRRVHELEAELASLRAHLDQVLEMPDHSGLADKTAGKVALPQPEEQAPQPFGVETEPAPDSPSRKPGGERRKRVKLSDVAEPVAAQANGADTPAAEPATAGLATADPMEQPAESTEPSRPASGA